METDAAAKQLDNEIDDASQQLAGIRQLRDTVHGSANASADGCNIIDQIQMVLKNQMDAVGRLETDCGE